ncbi:MAG TPA: DoxX family protein [Prolixibacteraceae bacterium]|jgi:putative oxidoreductase
MIKYIFNPGNYPSKINFVLLILRITVGVVMLSHGMAKFSKLFGDEPIMFADPIGVGQTASLALAVFAEVLCSILLIFGIATRFAAIPLIITMLVAVLIVHGKDGLDKQELPLLYLMIYLCIAITGAGKISIDHWIYHNEAKRNT